MVLTQPSVFIVSQPISKILHSFLVQNVSIFSEEFISEKFFGARALPRALRAKQHWGFAQKLAQKRWKSWFFTFWSALSARTNARISKFFLESNSLNIIDGFCTLNESKKIKNSQLWLDLKSLIFAKNAKFWKFFQKKIFFF